MNWLSFVFLCLTFVYAAESQFQAKIESIFQSASPQFLQAKYLREAREAGDLDAFDLITQLAPLDLDNSDLQDLIKGLVDRNETGFVDAVKRNTFTPGLNEMMGRFDKERKRGWSLTTADLLASFTDNDLSAFKASLDGRILNISSSEVQFFLQKLISDPSPEFLEALVASQAKLDNFGLLTWISDQRGKYSIDHIFKGISPFSSSDDSKDAVTLEMMFEEVLERELIKEPLDDWKSPNIVTHEKVERTMEHSPLSSNLQATPIRCTDVQQHDYALPHGLTLWSSSDPSYDPTDPDTEALALFQLSPELYRVPISNRKASHTPNGDSMYSLALLKWRKGAVSVPTMLDEQVGIWGWTLENMHRGIGGMLVQVDVVNRSVEVTAFGDVQQCLAVVSYDADTSKISLVWQSCTLALQPGQMIVFLPSAVKPLDSSQFLHGGRSQRWLALSALRQALQKARGNYPTELFALYYE